MTTISTAQPEPVDDATTVTSTAATSPSPTIRRVNRFFKDDGDFRHPGLWFLTLAGFGHGLGAR